MIKDDIYEVGLKIHTDQSGKIEILTGLLLSLGLRVNDIAESSSFPYSTLTVYFHSAHKAQTLRKTLSHYHLNEVGLKINRLKKGDWQTKWEKGFKPFQLTEHYDVVPIRYQGKYRDKKREHVFIDAEMAFGTGLHPTTKFMAGFVDRFAEKCRNFLDIGTGTGILAIIAFKSKAKNIEAVDISRDAVRVARKNFYLNNCPTIKVKTENGHLLKGAGKYDFICANIITQDLISLAPRIIPMIRKHGYLAVSGISVDSYAMFREQYKKYPLRCIKIEKDRGWTAILFKKTK